MTNGTGTYLAHHGNGDGYVGKMDGTPAMPPPLVDMVIGADL